MDLFLILIPEKVFGRVYTVKAFLQQVLLRCALNFAFVCDQAQALVVAQVIKDLFEAQ